MTADLRPAADYHGEQGPADNADEAACIQGSELPPTQSV